MELDIVASIFFGIIACEGRAEQERIKLDNHSQWDPHMAFEYLRQFRFNRQIVLSKQDLDDQKNQLIPIKQIEDFLGYFKIQAKPQEIQQIINIFSQGNHRSLDLENFMQITKSTQKLDKSYRKIFDQSKKFPNNEILNIISKIFDIELNLIWHTNKQKQKLQDELQTSIEDIFQQIDQQRKGFLEFSQVQNLMKGTGRPFSQRDYDALIRRIKKQTVIQDDSIYFGEFVNCVSNDQDLVNQDQQDVYDYSQNKFQSQYMNYSRYNNQQNHTSSRVNIENEYQQLLLSNQKLPNFTVQGEQMYMQKQLAQFHFSPIIYYISKYPTIPHFPSKSKEINQAMSNIFQDSQIDKTQLMGNPLFYQSIPGTKSEAHNNKQDNYIDRSFQNSRQNLDQTQQYNQQSQALQYSSMPPQNSQYLPVQRQMQQSQMQSQLIANRLMGQSVSPPSQMMQSNHNNKIFMSQRKV